MGGTGNFSNSGAISANQLKNVVLFQQSAKRCNLVKWPAQIRRQLETEQHIQGSYNAQFWPAYIMAGAAENA